ncbi:hypothetical protein BJY52DRAFT_1419816 [Lactarius psammicola]|nr:hypothetical protein BJY52DRAFT_1419816 [Lactarius psammicola]
MTPENPLKKNSVSHAHGSRQDERYHRSGNPPLKPTISRAPFATTGGTSSSPPALTMCYPDKWTHTPLPSQRLLLLPSAAETEVAPHLQNWRCSKAFEMSLNASEQLRMALNGSPQHGLIIRPYITPGGGGLQAYKSAGIALGVYFVHWLTSVHGDYLCQPFPNGHPMPTVKGPRDPKHAVNTCVHLLPLRMDRAWTVIVKSSGAGATPRDEGDWLCLVVRLLDALLSATRHAVGCRNARVDRVTRHRTVHATLPYVATPIVHPRRAVCRKLYY